MSLLAVLAFGVALFALSRARSARDLSRRVEELEREIRQLRAMVESGVSAAPPRSEPQRVDSTPTQRPPVPDGEREDSRVQPTSAGQPFEPGSPLDVSPPSPPLAPSPGPSFDWERWLGVQGAAVVGGGVLALAGLLFFRYSIEHGLLSPTLRVALGTLTGLGCIAAPRLPIARAYSWAVHALAGAGIVILYASFWAAGVLYELVPSEVAFVLMILVTSTGCLLALRERSQVIAVLGLLGGFATPYLLSSGSDRPIGLFGYILLLDGALLLLARRRGWPLLALLSLAGTLFYQIGWIGLRMGPERVLLGVGVLAVFAALYAFGTRPPGEEDRRRWLATQAGGLLLPFAFVLYVAGGGVPVERLWPMTGLMLLLSTFASIVGRRERIDWLPVATASAAVASVTAWTIGRGSVLAAPLELVSSCVLLAMVFHVFVELGRERVAGSAASRAALVATGGFFVVTILAVGFPGSTSLWPWLAGWLALALLLVRHGDLVVARTDAAGVPRFLSRLGSVGWGAVAFGLAFAFQAQARGDEFPGLATWLAVALGLAIVSQVIAIWRRKRTDDEAAGVFAAVIAIYLATVPVWVPVGPELALSAGLALGFLVALVATRLSSGWVYLASVALAGLTHFGWSDGRIAGMREPGQFLVALGLEGLAVVLFTSWPFLVSSRFRAERLSWVAASLAAPIWFLPLRQAFVVVFGDAVVGFVPLALAAVSVAAVARVRTEWEENDPDRNRHLAWFAAVALGFVSIAIPLQLEKEWITIGWALEGVAVLVLWQRLDQPGLKYFGLALLGAVTIRLVANDAVLGYHARSGWPIFNWILYTYLVPAAALAVAAARLAPIELDRLRVWERERLYFRNWPIGAGLCGMAAVLVVFVWMNLAIADWFSTGETIRISFGRSPARDLTTSIAWALFALALLTLGVARGLSPLRWVSLGFLLITISKVFLHDLGELEDLFRVLSLLGLAISLILVSLGYQRFVFRNVTEGK